MTQDSLGLAEEENENDMLCPNRNMFQTELEIIWASIDSKKTRARLITKEISDLNNLIGLKIEQIRSLQKPIRVEIEKIKKDIEKLASDRYELESQCPVRDMPTLEKRYRAKRHEYATTVFDVNYEKILVGEISSLKKNKDNLLKMSAVSDLIQKYKTKMSSLEEGLSSEEINALKNYKNNIKLSKRELASEFADIKVIINLLYLEKNTLVQKYNGDRARWISRNKKNRNAQYPSTFPSIRRFSESSMAEEKELEPFYEQKSDLRILISYLERLNVIHQNNLKNHPKGCSENDSDSADDYPRQFDNLTISPKNQMKQKSKSINKSLSSSTKNKKPDSQPITHDLNHYQIFGRTQITPPATYGNVPVVLVEVREKLASLDNKTNEISWDERDIIDSSKTFSSCNTSITDSAIGF